MHDLAKSGQAFTSAIDTDAGRAKYESLLNTLKSTNDQMVIYTERARETKDLGPNLGVWSDFIGGVFNANHGLGRFLGTLTRVNTTIARGGLSILQTLLRKAGDMAKMAAKHLADMAKNLAKAVGSGIVNKLKSPGDQMYQGYLVNKNWVDKWKTYSYYDNINENIIKKGLNDEYTIKKIITDEQYKSGLNYEEIKI